MLDSPFQSGGTVKTFPSTGQNKVLVLRLETPGTFLVAIKKDGVPSATSADYFLTAGDSLSIPGPGTVFLISITGDPKIYWTFEDK